MTDAFCKDTSRAFIWNRVLNIPFWTLITALPFILYKDMHASKLQLTLVIALKPISALIAPYWSMWVEERKDRLLSNIFWANLLRYIPLLFCPWMHSPWQVIAAFFFYMILSRGSTPAWMEMMKNRLPKESHARVFQTGSTLEYLGTALLPFVMGSFLDSDRVPWQWMFSISALLALASTLFIKRIPKVVEDRQKVGRSFREHVINPWLRLRTILSDRPDFSMYIKGFMLGGAGLMILHPALSLYFVDVLELSYTEMLLALGLCKGIGFAISSPFWTGYFQRVNIYFFSGVIALLAACFPVLLFFASSQLSFLYVAYLLYGIMQSGSELSWHMSGPYFSKDEDSSSYSAINMLTVGLRGCIVPFIGGLLLSFFGSVYVLGIGAIFCMMGSFYLLRCSSHSAAYESAL
ncbi:MAG: MFS transporter [Waddliaceae bacterium]